MRKVLLLSFLVLLESSVLYAQSSIVGRVTDSLGKPIEGAHISLEGAVGKSGTFTDKNGDFNLSTTEGKVTLVVTHVSYKPVRKSISELYTFIEIQLEETFFMAEQVVVSALKADRDMPITYTNLELEDIEKRNFGQDVPVLLETMPAVTTTSDAGTGIGYTGIRIRGSDATRINVTVNGIPLNDSESHGVYWVNLPDLSSSTNSFQVQRGVGTSTNGAAAFGATINMETTDLNKEAYGKINISGGSFNTLKNSVQFGTGLMNGHWSLEGRASRISSDGYIDRAFSDLKSTYLEGGYFDEKLSVRAIAMLGNERTYQSWWGTPEAVLKKDVEGMNLVADLNEYTDEQRENLLNSGRTFNYYTYENEIDNYSQDHYQLHVSSTLADHLYLNTALHYTYGRGYYEQFRNNDRFENYDMIPIDTVGGQITKTDLIRQRWLDNDFYGFTTNLIYEAQDFQLVWGGSWNNYKGDHFGEVIWAEYYSGIDNNHRYYDNNAEKSDLNIFSKLKYEVGGNVSLFADFQYREIDYEAFGSDNERVEGVPNQIAIDKQFDFINPKFGFSYFPTEEDRIYVSYARGHREPVRADFIDNKGIREPVPEKMDNVEMGWDRSAGPGQIIANVYFMNYKNQLVLTGELNDVGAPVRTNVDRSYRAGIELSASLEVFSSLKWMSNLTLSRNKIARFEEVIYNYGADWLGSDIEKNIYENVDLSFSPDIIAASILDYDINSKLSISLISKYTGRQFLDNTGNISRSIDPYFIQNARLNYMIKPRNMSAIKFGLLLNNIFNLEYESNGYTFGYKAGTFEVRENYYYPQAGTNFLISAEFAF